MLILLPLSCADPGIFSGVRGPGLMARKQFGCFFWVFFSVLNLFYSLQKGSNFTVYRREPMVLLQRKLYFSKDPEGSQHFPGGWGGVQMLISIETHITCDFPGESGHPIPPLDQHMP